MLNKYNQNNSIIFNQIKSKLLFKNHFNFNFFKSVQLQTNFNKLKTFNEVIILEGLFLLEFIGSLKSCITYNKKMYQHVNVQISNRLRENHIIYLFCLLKILYFPVILRRNEPVTQSLDKSFNYYMTLVHVNIFPFVPDIFFKWNYPINCFFSFKKTEKIKNILFLKYWNFPLSFKI